MVASQDDKRELADRAGPPRGPEEAPGRGAGREHAGQGEAARLRAALESVVASLPPDLAPDLALMHRLQRSEARYKALVMLSSNLVWVRDAQVRFVEPCEDWERFTGQTFEEYRGYGWLDALHPDDRERARQKLIEALENLEPMVRLRYRLRHRGEQGLFDWRHVEVTASPVHDTSGQVVEWVGMVRDRTAQHEWETQRALQTDELARSNRELEDFAYVAAHDLKEPLRGIRLIASFLEEDSRGKLDEDGRRRIGQLHELCGRMQVLLDALLESAKLASTPLSLEAVELAAAVAEGLQQVEAQILAEKASVTVHEGLQGLRVWADGVRLAQVIANLVSNGLKYNESELKSVDIGLATHADAVATLYVRDNGIGLPPDQLEGVFRMFRRLHPRELYGGGAGAGLAIVKRIVERHAGRVWLESAGPGLGATAYVSLPTVETGPLDRVSSAEIRSHW